MLLEWMLIAAVAVIAFGPKELPRLAYWIGRTLRYVNQQKAALTHLWQTHALEDLLSNNEKRAKAADAEYINRS